jgi:hypothetical protein
MRQDEEPLPVSRLDELRSLRPHLGFALYALDPGGDVTFEVYDGDQVFTFTGPTSEAAIEKAFPPPVPLAPEEPPAPEPPPPTPSIFD